MGALCLPIHRCMPRVPFDDKPAQKTKRSTRNITRAPIGVRPSPPMDVPTGELQFTTSAYGGYIPIVFGADRLAGNIIWAGGTRVVRLNVDNVEHVFRRTSFALALCEGEVRNVVRLWIGERLIFDYSLETDGNGLVIPGTPTTQLLDLTSEESPYRSLPNDARLTKITFFNGSEAQVPADIMIAELGTGLAPAYRGVSYLLFDDFIVDDLSLEGIFVEVVANADDVIPRSFGVPSTLFDDVTSLGLIYDPTFNRIYAGATDSSGTGPVPDGDGWSVFDNSSLEELGQIEIRYSAGLDSDTGLNTSNAGVMSNGSLLVGQLSGNSGILFTLNTVTNRIDDLIGPGGSLSGHSEMTGFGALGIGSLIFQGRGISRPLADIFCGFGAANRSLGFAEITTNNQIKMLSVINQCFDSGRSIGRGVVYTLTPESHNETPTWMDGTTSTRGTNVLYVTGASTERQYYDISVVCYDNPDEDATPSVPVFVSVGTVSCALMAGTGEDHQLAHMFIDGQDGFLVMCFNVDGGRQDRIIKLNPFEGSLVWSKAITYYNRPSNAVWSLQSVVVGGRYAWIGEDDALYTITLDTGDVTRVSPNITMQGLDIPVNLPQQTYNGIEHSITYFGSTSTKLVTKIYVERVARDSVLVSDVVTALLRRVGLNDTYIDVEDLALLALGGYTIRTLSALRQIYTELASVYRFDMIESNGTLKYKGRGASPVETIPAKYLSDISENGWLQEAQDPEFVRRRKVSLTYRDFGREYGNNVQSYALPQYTNETFNSEASLDITVPFVFSADDAKRLAEILLYSKIVYETSYNFKLPQRYLTLEPGDVVDLTLSDTETITCRLTDVNAGTDSSIDVTAVREDADIYNDIVALAGNAGRFEPTRVPQLTIPADVHYIQVPYLSVDGAEATEDAYAFYFYVLSRTPTQTNRGDILVYLDDTPTTLGAPSGQPTWGYVVTPPVETTSYWSTDNASTLRVHLVSTAGLAVASAASKDALTNNSNMNLALVGNELIQFQTATFVSGTTYDLTGLVRGKFGTEEHINSHTAGERFILIGGATGVRDHQHRFVTTPLADTPNQLVEVAVPSNNLFQPLTTQNLQALNMRPWAVADTRASWSTDDAVLTWQRRSRYDAEWADDLVEVVSFLEEAESYRLFLYDTPGLFDPNDPDTYLRRVDVTTNTHTYTLAEQTADGFDNTTDTLYVYIFQTGSATGQDNGAPTAFLLEHK